MSARIANASSFVVRNRTAIKTAIMLGLVVASVIGMALQVDAVALAGGGNGGTY